MSLEIVRKIRESVHGTVDVSALEDKVLKHEAVQRLRRIKQLAFLHLVFPGATHTRFEHSLGVMQLAGTAWAKLKENQIRLSNTAQKISKFTAIEKKGPDGMVHGLLSPTFSLINQIFESDYNLQVLRLAGLLHDLGHPPFSHSGEGFMPSLVDVLKANPSLPDYIRDYIQKKLDAASAKGIDPATLKAKHEIFSILLIDHVLKATYRDFPDLQLQVDPQDVVSVIKPEIAPSTASPIYAMGLYRLFNELIAGELDIDRMDYLLRDSQECGVVYGIFDEGRTLDALSLYVDPVDKGLHVAINFSGMTAFDDYLRARQSMYLQVYFHKTSACCEAMAIHMAEMVGDWRIPAKISEFVKMDEYNIGGELLKVARSTFKDAAQLEKFETLLRDLLYRRRLWKMVFETIAPVGDKAADKKLEKAKKIIEKVGCEFEELSSANTLTRFLPRSDDELSKNYLRVIKKDEVGFPRVVPIEDCSASISVNRSVAKRRLYVENGKNSKGETYQSLTKEKIINALSK